MAFVRHCWITKLSLLLLVMSRALLVVDTRPARGSPTGDLIAGREFLKLFMERDEFQRGLHSAEYQGHTDGPTATRTTTTTKSFEHNRQMGVTGDSKASTFGGIPGNEGDGKNVDESGKLKTRNNARSLSFKEHTGANTHHNPHTNNRQDQVGDKEVVKLVTSGSKIVFLEEYDDDVDDAVVDAVARDIDLKREKKVKKINHKTGDESRFYQENKSLRNDDFKVVAVSVSSSSKRGSQSHQHHHHNHHHPQASNETPKQVSKFSIKSSLFDESETRFQATSSTTKRPFKVSTTTSTTTMKTTTAAAAAATTTTTTATAPPPVTTTVAATISTSGAATNDIDEFINRSHKSEFSIEEAEPLTMPQKQHKMRRAHAATIPDAVSDSQNSASTNIQNVLASPMLISSASLRSSSIISASVGRNSTQPQIHPASTRQARINQSGVTFNSNNDADDIDDADTDADADADDGDGDGNGNVGTGDTAELVEEKLLPFQTVIYHDTKEGHGPQSRSISYSSISQNVDDLQTWQHTGILAEAKRNVSESLRPIVRSTSSSQTIQTQPNESEPSKFYSVPSKMYSVPSKFYSEPSKMYSQPAKVYGEQEKFYSQPSKVYGQPSKFYSEPSKVYSQPSKVYGEPAKTYWPQTTSITTTTTSTSTTTTTMTPASKTIITTFSPFASPFNLTSRRPPAIVSRIAFGEAQSSEQRTTTTRPPGVGYNHQHFPQNSYQSHKGYTDGNPSNGNAQNTQSRRVLFNLDKLPYDLLNAPQQHFLGLDFSKSPPNPCAEPTLSNTQQQQQQHLRQHSSLSDQHSNQNAKGLPNRDLVKCVTKFSAHHSPATSESAARRPSPPPSSPHQHFTTERSHIDELYRPTPEQNYEIEESVSVMTNGRAHGIQDGLGRGIGLGAMTTTSTASPSPSPQPKVQPTRSRLRPGSVSAHRTFGPAKTNTKPHDDREEHDAALVHQNSNNGNKNSHHHYQNNNDYNEDNGDADADADADDGLGVGVGSESDSDSGDDNDDSKVAYVVEGRNYRKYRVEEKTDDGFIVGEFGVVDHNDGNLRGVRYTADSTINPSLIQKALLTFLKLK